MEAKNFRIGNLIKQGEVVEIERSEKDSFRVWNNTEQETYKSDWFEIEPIPLTDEWLLKLGFNKVGINYEKDWLALWKNKTTGTVDFVLNEPHSGKRHIKPLKYVHELQNLFFAISGEELEYKR